MPLVLVRIGPVEQQGYPVTLRSEGDPPGGAAIVDHIPADALSPDTIAGWTTTLDGADGDQPQLQVIGEGLFDLLAQKPEVKAALLAGNVVLDVAAPELRAVPWELLHHGGQYLALRPGKSIWRGEWPEGWSAADPEWPLKMMVVVGSEPGDTTVNAEDELLGIAHALAPVRSDIAWSVIQRQPLAGPDGLRARLTAAKPHILHFIGHGIIVPDPVTAKPTAQLLVYDEQAQVNQPWTVAHIRQDLQQWTPRLVVLNSCDGANSREATVEVARTFTDMGVPAVVGMQTIVGGKRAVTFAEELYTALAGPARKPPQPVSEALVAARAAVQRDSATHCRDWAAPTLHLVGAHTDVLRVGHPIDAARRKAVARLRWLQNLGTGGAFVDRRDDRFRMWDALYEQTDNVVVVHGASKVGKTHFAKWSVERAALVGEDVRYVDFDHQTPDLATTLDRIRGMEWDPARAPLAPFEEFDALVRPWRQDENGHFTAEGLHHAEQLLAMFMKGLVAQASVTPLVIVLDHMAEQTKNTLFREYLEPHLLQQVHGRGEERPIRFVLVARELDPFGLKQTTYQTVSLHKFAKGEYAPLTNEFVRGALRGLTSEVDRKRFQKRVAKCVGALDDEEDWPAETLDTLYMLLTRDA